MRRILTVTSVILAIFSLMAVCEAIILVILRLGSELFPAADSYIKVAAGVVFHIIAWIYLADKALSFDFSGIWSWATQPATKASKPIKRALKNVWLATEGLESGPARKVTKEIYRHAETLVTRDPSAQFYNEVQLIADLNRVALMANLYAPLQKSKTPQAAEAHDNAYATLSKFNTEILRKSESPSIHLLNANSELLDPSTL